jgi:type I restriction enzyme S subunit
LIHETEKSLTAKGLKLCRKIPAHAICIVCIGSTIGKIGISTVVCSTNQQINTIIPETPEISELIFYACKLYLPFQLRREAGLQAVPIVNKEKFSGLNVAFPVEDREVRKISERLAAASHDEGLLRTTLMKLRFLKTALMQDLLTGKRRVTPLLGKEDD